MIVTGITVHTKTKVKVSLDNRESFQLYNREIKRYGIQEGAELSNYNEILRDTLIPRAKKRAMHLLEKMDRTEADIRSKLHRNGYPDIAIDEAVKYVMSYNYVDDKRYAYSYTRSYRDSRSCNRIRHDLYKKGIDKDIIEQAIADEYNTDEYELISKHIAKRGYNCDTATIQDRDKMYRYLLRQGFDMDLITKALSR